MDKHKKAVTPRVLIQLLVVLLLIPFLPLLITSRWDWWKAWIYAVLLVLALGVSRWLASRRQPEHVARLTAAAHGKQPHRRK